MNGKTAPRTWTLAPGLALILPGIFALAVAVLGFRIAREHAVMFASFMGAVATVVVWAAVLYVKARAADRKLTLVVTAKKTHWVQAIAQFIIFFWWARYVPIVDAFIPFIVAQVLFAYAVEGLLNWSRRETHYLGFGPIPIILSINLFLWFRPDWFYWQFVMIVVGFLAKELVHWQRDGRSAHIFNPSSFPLALASLILILTHGSDATFGQVIANTIFDPPYIYLVLFLAAVPAQFLFGVARTSVAALVTLMVISLVYFQVNGTYLFLDAHVPVPVFIGLLFLVTDPSTSPRTDLGRILFGVLYAVFTAILFVLLPLYETPTFYDKLLPIPILNLMVRFLDRIAVTRPFSALDPGRPLALFSPMGRNLVYGTAIAAVFTGLFISEGVGDHHPGQYLPFWEQACEAGSGRACRYQAFLTETYCNNGSGWACNEAGIRLAEARRDPGPLFLKGCELGFETACANVGRGDDVTALAHAPPADQDLPIILRGTKPNLTQRDPAVLHAIGCEQGWTDMCAAAGS